MSDDVSKPRQPNSISQLSILGILVLVGALALTAVILIAHDRLQSTTSSEGQDTSARALGLTAQGFKGASDRSGSPIAEIAAQLAIQSSTFTPGQFDEQVAAAKKRMSVAEQGQYAQLLAKENIRALVKSGVKITTSLVHFGGDPKKYAYLGVVSLTETSGEFVMVLQQTATIAGSKRTQVTPLLVDVTLGKIGNTWVLSDVQGLLGL
ncbi:MAG: hypothetical protein ACTHJM_09595 [Marmoricola sp.]